MHIFYNFNSFSFARTLGHEQFFQLYQNLEDNGENIIFSTPNLFELIANRVIHCDGTFKTVPHQPPMLQLFTVHITENNYVSIQ